MALEEEEEEEEEKEEETVVDGAERRQRVNQCLPSSTTQGRFENQLFSLMYVMAMNDDR